MALVKYNDRSLRNLTTVPAAVTGNSPGALVHIKTLTASSSATLSFVNGSSDVVLSSTYPIYKFEFIGIHPQTDATVFQMNGSTDTGSNYNVTKTTTFWRAQNNEADDSNALGYVDGSDSAQQTGFQILEDGNSSDNDHASSGYLHLFNPSSAVFQKLFYSRMSSTSAGDFNIHTNVGGAFNSTSAINNIQFKFSSGNIDSGTIKLYGVN